MWRWILNSNVIGSVSQQYVFCRVMGRVIKREMGMRIDAPLDTNVDIAVVDLEVLDLDTSVALVVLDLFRFVAVDLDPFIAVDLDPLIAIDLERIVVVDLDPFKAINCRKELSE